MATIAPSLHYSLLYSPNPRGRRRCNSQKTHFDSQRNRLILTAFSSSSQPSEAAAEAAATAESCVNSGLSLFSKGRVKDALVQFENALDMNPNPIEAQAALYNKACCHAYRGEGKRAAECLRTALRDYNLKFSVILDDPDLASFRALPEFKELQEEVWNAMVFESRLL
ncbi:uncharacterized protein A4U43_C03F31670 [Asparagus officinalis]|uniref:Uncharacterized protein n=1 Tax=Asparagus officinalis TaxID=4686 RepID=A0A5P1FEF7_ASPOF|nr:uncharacterized protein A4U43_C03F31670 [Asparagus officinalis]